MTYDETHGKLVIYGKENAVMNDKEQELKQSVCAKCPLNCLRRVNQDNECPLKQQAKKKESTDDQTTT